MFALQVGDEGHADPAAPVDAAQQSDGTPSSGSSASVQPPVYHVSDDGMSSGHTSPDTATPEGTDLDSIPSAEMAGEDELRTELHHELLQPQKWRAATHLAWWQLLSLIQLALAGTISFAPKLINSLGRQSTSCAPPTVACY